jgi:hypothetical protein
LASTRHRSAVVVALQHDRLALFGQVVGHGLHQRRHVGGLGRLGAAGVTKHLQHRVDQLVEVVVGAELQPEHAAARVAQHGEHDHRQRRGLLHPAAQVEAVGVGQHQVEHHHVERFAAGHQQPAHLGAAGGRRDAHAETLQVFLQRHADLAVVVDHQGVAAHSGGHQQPRLKAPLHESRRSLPGPAAERQERAGRSGPGCRRGAGRGQRRARLRAR